MTTPSVNNRYPGMDLQEFISRRMRDTGAGMNCCLIGQIVSFNASNQTAVVNVVFQKIVKNVVPLPNTVGETADQVIPYPQLVNVPVFFLQGGSSYITLPIEPGDTCLLIFNDRDMDNWFDNGTNPALPASDRIHNINDAIALIGIRNLTNSLPNYNPNVISNTDQTGERLCQSGMLMAFGGSAAPSGWLLCQGQSVAKATYPFLFAAIGYTYGGSGANFNLPNMQGQVAAGIGGTLGLTLGQEFGEVNHTLTIPEMPSHSHGLNASVQSGSATNCAIGPGNSFQTADTGGGLAHNNVQPSLGVNWIIKI